MLTATPLTRWLLPALLLATPLFSACDAIMGKEVARLPINAVSAPGKVVEKEVTVPLKKDDKIALWSEMDMSYQGEVKLVFQVQVLQNGQPFQQMAFDPREKNFSVKEVKKNINGDVDWSFMGKNAELTIPLNGNYTFRSRLLAEPAHGPEIRKAELVLRK